MIAHVKIMGIYGQWLFDEDCDNWENDGSMVKIYFQKDNVVVRILGVPLHNIKYIESNLKLE